MVCETEENNFLKGKGWSLYSFSTNVERNFGIGIGIGSISISNA